jgi:hypothetical protein
MQCMFSFYVFVRVQGSYARVLAGSGCNSLRTVNLHLA